VKQARTKTVTENSVVHVAWSEKSGINILYMDGEIFRHPRVSGLRQAWFSNSVTGTDFLESYWVSGGNYCALKSFHLKCSAQYPYTVSIWRVRDNTPELRKDAVQPHRFNALKSDSMLSTWNSMLLTEV
jgi:hypothetical protein